MHVAKRRQELVHVAGLEAIVSCSQKDSLELNVLLVQQLSGRALDRWLGVCSRFDCQRIMSIHQHGRLGDCVHVDVLHSLQSLFVTDVYLQLLVCFVFLVNTVFVTSTMCELVSCIGIKLTK